MRVAISGGCGFIGSHIVEHFLKNTDFEIVVLDKLSYSSSGLDRLRDIKAFNSNRVRVITCDFNQELSTGVKREIGNGIDYFLHLAAETHVDNSISDPWPFVQANVIGTFHMLQWARELKDLKKLIYFSTDEVFGPAAPNIFSGSYFEHEAFADLRQEKWEYRSYCEWDRYNSGNPYSATKAGGEELCLAWANTYKVPVAITHCMNVFGERQHYEKFIPKVVRSILFKEKIYIHSNKDKTKAGSRFYIHGRNVADAVLFLLDKAVTGDKYNIVGEKEVDNLTLVNKIAYIMGVPYWKEPECELIDFHSSRPGHDLRYSLDGSKMKQMGWEPPKDFENSLEKTINWMLAPENKHWLNLE